MPEEELVTPDITLSDFIAQAWKILEPDTSYSHNWHIDYLSEELEAVTNGDTRRLIINIAPRHMKSLLVSVMWPVWEWTRAPWTRWMFASYVDHLAEKHSTDRRTVIASEWYQERWGPLVKLAKDNNQKRSFENTRRGTMKAVSFGGSATGLGGNRLVIDDPQNPKEASSETERKNTIDFFTKTLHSRLNQPQEDAIVIVMQRLHEKDLVGYLLEKLGDGADGYRHVKLPSEAPKKVTVTYPITKKVRVREEGEVLWKDRYPKEVLRVEKINLGAYDYAAQHQQEPAPLEGGTLHSEWWRWYNHRKLDVVRYLTQERVLFVDTAFEQKEENDYSAMAVWGLVPHNPVGLPPGFYCLDIWRGKPEFPELKAKLPQLFSLWDCRIAVVEKKASGHSLIQEVRRKHIPVRAVTPVRDKLARVIARTGYLEEGMVFLPDYHPMLQEFLEEHRLFPKAEHDDWVDTTSMMLDYWAGRIPSDEVQAEGQESWSEFFEEAL